MKTPIIKYFKYEHLPPRLREVSAPLCDLAQELDSCLPDGPEKSAGLRKLLEAKDCFVRAAIDTKEFNERFDKQLTIPLAERPT